MNRLILPTDRRHFIKSSAVALAAASTCATHSIANHSNATQNNATQNNAAEKAPASDAETMTKVLYESLTDDQRSKVCYDWDFVDPSRGLLRTRVANNWMMNDREINSDFYTAEQKDLIRKVFEGVLNPEWVSKFDKQLEDDCGGFGEEQSIGIFGKPGDGKFELVLTGRHMTLRCDGNSSESVAFGGPIFYGHAPGGDEEADHHGNVFWEQALVANKLYMMLDGKQQKLAEVPSTPAEHLVGFQGRDGRFSGIPITELAADQKSHMQTVLQKLVEPFRAGDQQEALKCLESQGGLDACYLSFFTDDDLGKDRLWDNWRLEGPSFVWHFRGAPHVHVWVNVADSASVELNA